MRSLKLRVRFQEVNAYAQEILNEYDFCSTESLYFLIITLNGAKYF